MKGWKTWAAAAGGFATGLSMIAAAILSDFDPAGIKEGLLICSGALGLIGVGHKIEKSGE